MRAYIAVGANLGDAVATVQSAIAALRKLPRSQMVAVSSLYRTAPVGLHHQPDFINAVVSVETRLGSCELLEALFSIEGDFGRQRSVPNAPRTLDLDLLLYGDTMSEDPQLTLPHPRMHQRAFVLAPLSEIAPGMAIPGRGPIEKWLARCGDQRIEILKSVA